MTEKQVILSKVEYDEMEQEIKDLKSVVESRTISAIVRPHYHNWCTSLNNWKINFVLGIDDNTVIKALQEDLDEANKQKEECESRMFEQGQTMSKLYDQIRDMERKPWYKRLLNIK